MTMDAGRRQGCNAALRIVRVLPGNGRAKGELRWIFDADGVGAAGDEWEMQRACDDLN